MYLAVTQIQVAPADTAEFERAFTASMDGTLHGVTGLRRATLVRREDDGGEATYLATTEFATEPDYQAYLTSDAFQAAHSGHWHAPMTGATVNTYREVHEVAP